MFNTLVLIAEKYLDEASNAQFVHAFAAAVRGWVLSISCQWGNFPVRLHKRWVMIIVLDARVSIDTRAEAEPDAHTEPRREQGYARSGRAIG